MNRQIWTAVLATVALLLVASALEAPERWREAARLGAALASRASATGAAFAAAHRLELLYSALGAGVAGLLGLALVRPRPRRERNGHGLPWKAVVEMARQGDSVETIARSTNLAQDAVRTLLVPIERDPEFHSGNSFRHERPGKAPRTPRRKPRRDQ